MLLFPSLDALRLAITTAAVPPAVGEAPAVAAFAADGAVRIQPSKPLSKAVREGLERLGVRECARLETGDGPAEAVGCWAQVLPLSRVRSAETPGPTTAVVFEVRGGEVAGLVGEILRLGNDRQGLRWLAETDGGTPRALLRVVGPPYYALLRALDRDDRDGGPRAYLENAPRVLVEVGYTHPLVDRLRPPPGRLLLLGPPRRWRVIEEGPFRDIYEVLEFRLPGVEVRWRGVERPERFTIPLRLARGGASEASELWVLRDGAGGSLDDLVRHADDRLLSRLAFAVAEGEGGRSTVVLRVRPSKQGPPVLVLDGDGYRPYLRLPNLFLPVGTRLHPPLRRDAVARLLAADPSRVTWLAPGVDGGFVPESLPEEAFRPLGQWVDYVLDREHRPLDAWVRSSRFDFDPFVCRDDLEDGPPTGPKRKRGKGLLDEAHPDAEASGPGGRVGKAPARPHHDLAAELSATAAVAPGELVRRLGDLEARFLAIEGPLDAAERPPLWRKMAGLNAALGRSGDATVCWANALWGVDGPPPDWAETWARAESEASGRRPEDARAFDRLLSTAKPSAADVRALAAGLVWASLGGPGAADLTQRLGRVQHFLERHEATVPVRVAWLAWLGLARLAGGDVLTLARARDRVLERLHQHGLSRDLDLPSFLRFTGGGACERARLARDHLVRLHALARSWVKTGLWNGPFTGPLVDLLAAYGLARLGAAEAAGAALRSGLGGLPRNDPVVDWLGKAFDYRVRQAIDGKAAAGPLPIALMRKLDPMGRVGTEDQKKQGKYLRYKIDRLREHSRILEPHEKVDPYRHWHGPLADELTHELGRVVDVTDRGELADRMARLFAVRHEGEKAASRSARVLRAALDVGFRLGESFALDLFDRVIPTVDRFDDLPRQADLLERALHLAAHFDQPGHVRAYVSRFDALLAAAEERSAGALEPLLGQCFRGLRKLGLRDEIDRLLDRMAALILRGRGVTSAGGLTAAAERTGPGAVAWSRSLRLLLHVAAGWSYFGQADRARPVYDEARALLFQGDLPPIEQTALACVYVNALGQAPADLALPRLEELFRGLERVHDTFTVVSHYSVSRLDLIQAVVLTVASDDFTLGETGRRWLEDEEFFVRRRIHRDVRAALGGAD